MANRHRGEVNARLDGRDYTLCLTLGSLAELEDAFAAQDVSALAERFSQARLKSSDMLRVIAAGLRGGGYTVTNEELAEMQVDGGALGYARIVAELLTATFSALPEPSP